MDDGNQSSKHWWMNTTYPIKDMKIKSSQTKFLIKMFTLTCVAKILPKLEQQDQWLWAIMSSTNTTKLYAHEMARCLWAWTPLMFKSSSSSYTWSLKKFTHFLSFFLKASWSSLCLSCMNFFEFLFALLLLLFSLSNHLRNHVLVACVLATFPSSCF